MQGLTPGLGGLGCSILDILSVSGLDIGTLSLIDMDRIEEVNLPSQPLYTRKDIGRFKSDVAKERLSASPFAVHSLPVDIEDAEASLLLPALSQSDIIICSFDSYRSRVSLNYQALSVQRKKPLLYVDCGVEGYKYHVFYSFIKTGSPCLYCLRSLFLEKPLAVPRKDSEDVAEKQEKIYICSVRNIESLRKRATNENKESVLLSIIEEFRDEADPYASAAEFFNSNIAAGDIAPVGRSYVHALDRRVVPNVIFVNRIAGATVSSIVKMSLHTDLAKHSNFYYYSGSSAPYSSNLLLERDRECIVCNAFTEQLRP